MNEILFYYLRNNELNKNDLLAKKGQPFGVVAIRENEDGTINRGVSVCSPKDRYDKKAGRGIALKRLLLAEEKQCNVEFGVYTGREDRKNLGMTPFFESSSYRVNPTPEEYRMLHKPEDF